MLKKLFRHRFEPNVTFLKTALARSKNQCMNNDKKVLQPNKDGRKQLLIT
jgi:hypothetical protein